METLTEHWFLPPYDGSSWGLVLWGASLQALFSFLFHQAISMVVIKFYQ